MNFYSIYYEILFPLTYIVVIIFSIVMFKQIKMQLNKLVSSIAKQESISFAKFKSLFQQGENWIVNQEQIRLCGIFSYRGESDDNIWNEYQASKLSKIKIRNFVIFKELEAVRPMFISYLRNEATIEYFNRSKNNFEHMKVPLSELSPAKEINEPTINNTASI